LKRIDQAIKAADKAHGLKDDEEWIEGKAPDDVAELYRAWGRRHDAIMVAFLREYGEADMADLRLADPDAYSDRIEKVRAKIWPTFKEDSETGKQSQTTGS
jgi:hypothetical protein